MRKRCKNGTHKTTCSACDKPGRANQRYCLKCHAAYMRCHRPAHSELKPEAKRKANARAYANVYLRNGKIEKAPCEVCGDENSQMHHDDYTKPLSVRWFCRKHHLEIHPTKKSAVNVPNI